MNRTDAQHLVTAITEALNPTVNVLLVARAQAEVLREETDVIRTRLLSEEVYTDEFTGVRITEIPVTPERLHSLMHGT